MALDRMGGTKVPGWTPEIGDRISWAIDALGGLKRAAEVAGTSDETLAHWRDGRTRPTFFGLLGLATATGRDLNWIATGEPPRGRGNQSGLTDTPLDTARLEAAVAIIEEWLVANRRVMPPDRKAKVIAMAYEILVESSDSSGDDAARNNVVRLLRVAS